MKDLFQFFINNPLLLAALAILVVALLVAIIKKVLKAAVIISIIIVLLGILFYVMRDKLGFAKEVAPVEKVLEKGNKAVESASPQTFQKAKKELGSDTVKQRGRVKQTGIKSAKKNR
jgi:lysylphosphatidylglycerol synthetase-like protein (DUF2156 family)